MLDVLRRISRALGKAIFQMNKHKRLEDLRVSSDFWIVRILLAWGNKLFLILLYQEPAAS